MAHTAERFSKSGSRENTTAIAVLFFGTMAIISDIYIAQPILPLLSASFGVSPTVAALAVSLNIFALSSALLVYGPLSDYLGRKPVMVATGFLLSIPTVLISFTDNFSAFLVLRAVQGLFAAGIAAIAMAYITEEFPPGKVGKAIGVYISSMVASGLFGRVFGGVLAGLFRWQTAFLTFGILNFAGTLLILRFLPASKNFKRNTGLFDSYSGMFNHFKNRRLVGAFIIAFALFFTFTGSFSYVTFYLSAPPFNLSTVVLSLIFLVYVTGVISPVAGALSSRIGRRPVIAFGLAATATGITLTLVKFLPAVVAGLLLLCAGLFSAQPAASALVGDNASTGKGSATSLYLFFYYTGGSLGAVLPGLFWNSHGWPGVIAVCLLTLVTAAFSLAALCR
ncbi:MAG TPA: MFS transporter [Bacillota bacterium]|nr:MFS transporter [Bacillota bacterium]